MLRWSLVPTCVLIVCVSACNRTASDVTPSTQAHVATVNTAGDDESRASAADAAKQSASPAIPAIHVYPTDSIQQALDQAAQGTVKRVVVHAGVYRPDQPRQAFIWFNKAHDGIELVAEGEVTLTSANPDVASRNAASFPAIVNHVVYFGDGVGPSTRMSGFRITGANNFVTTKGPAIEPTPESELDRTAYFYFDGGGIKIYGRAYPVLENLEIVDNYSSPCGAGISVEHRGYVDQHVTIRNCVFRNNRVPITGAALDLLGHDKGSAAVIENCLFVNNASNCSMDSRSMRLGSWMPKAGHGAITLFPPSKAQFRNCTIVGNRNGVDDLSPQTTYEKCIFWNNTMEGGWVSGTRYETAIANADGMTDCFIGGAGIIAHRAEPDPQTNVLDAPDPEFDERYVPQNVIYEDVGYRPVESRRVNAADQSRQPKTAVGTSASQGPLEIRAMGHDFNWYFCYPGDDGVWDTSDDVVIRRHLYVPAGRRVELELNSNDYLYSFKLPDQDTNEIAIPGTVHRATFAETQSGTYPLVGDQFCGYVHPDLIGRMIVQPASQFTESILKNSVRAPF